MPRFEAKTQHSVHRVCMNATNVFVLKNFNNFLFYFCSSGERKKKLLFHKFCCTTQNSCFEKQTFGYLHKKLGQSLHNFFVGMQGNQKRPKSTGSQGCSVLNVFGSCKMG
jgi:hypothetical protein